jgi:hypothetical protein
MTDASVATAKAPLLPARPPDTAPYESGVAVYLASAERMRGVADVALKVGIALALLILVAWAAGLLPGAVRLF